MDRLQAMETFVRVVEAGSFSAVAKESGSTQSAVSKQVAALENHLGAKLLSRTTRALTVTAEGQVFFEQAQHVVTSAQQAESSVRKGTKAVQGLLRIGAGVGFGRFVLFPVVQAFMEKYPDVEVDLQLSDTFVDVVAQGLDVVVRVGNLQDSSLLAQSLGFAQRNVVASRELAAKLNKASRMPQTPQDLQHHNCIVYTGLSITSTWSFVAEDAATTHDVKISGRLRTNSSETVREAVLAGLGIGFMPSWYFQEELKQGEVIRLLPRFTPHRLPISAVYPASRKHSARVAAFIAFAQKALHA
jgi:DNA-binding transcriptional LysR family regulator